MPLHSDWKFFTDVLMGSSVEDWKHAYLRRISGEWVNLYTVDGGAEIAMPRHAGDGDETGRPTWRFTCKDHGFEWFVPVHMIADIHTREEQ